MTSKALAAAGTTSTSHDKSIETATQSQNFGRNFDGSVNSVSKVTCRASTCHRLCPAFLAARHWALWTRDQFDVCVLMLGPVFNCGVTSIGFLATHQNQLRADEPLPTPLAPPLGMSRPVLRSGQPTAMPKAGGASKCLRPDQPMACSGSRYLGGASFLRWRLPIRRRLRRRLRHARRNRDHGEGSLLSCILTPSKFARTCPNRFGG